jgi:hypothetical protein
LPVETGTAGCGDAGGSIGTAGGELAGSAKGSLELGAKSDFLAAGADGFASPKASAGAVEAALGATMSVPEPAGVGGAGGCESAEAGFCGPGAVGGASAKSDAETRPLDSVVVE